MTPETAQQLFLLLFGGGGLGAIGYMLRFKAERKKLGADTGKIEADAVSVLTGTAVSLIAPLHAEIKRLTDQVDALEAQVKEAKKVLRDTIAKLKAAEAIIDHHGLTLDNSSLNPDTD